MSQVSFKSALRSISLYVFTFISFSSNAFSQEATLIEVGTWGSGEYFESVLHNGLIYHSIANSSVVDVQSPDLNNQDGLVGKIKFPDNVFNLYSCNDYLVTSSGQDISFYNVDNLDSPILKYSLDIANVEPNSVICDEERIVVFDGKQQLLLVSYIDGQFSLADVYQLADEILVEDTVLSSVSMALENQELSWVTNRTGIFDNSGVFYTQQFTISDMQFEAGELKSLDTDSGIFNSLSYTHSGRFITYLPNNATLYLLNPADEALELSPVSVFGTPFIGLNVLYNDNKIWVISDDKYLTIYDFTNFSVGPELTAGAVISDGIDAGIDRWQDLKAFFLGGRFFIRHMLGFSEVLVNDSGVSSAPLYDQSGNAGLPVVIGDKAYLPRRGRIDVVNVGDINAPVLENQVAATEQNQQSSLYVNDATLVFESFSQLKTVELSDEVNFDEGFEASVDGSSSFVSRKALNDNVFAFSYDTQLLHRFNVAEEFSVLEGFDSFDFNLPEDSYQSIGRVEGLGDKVFILFDSPQQVLMFDNADDPIDANPQFVISDSALRYVAGIASNDEYLFAIVERSIESYALDGDSLIKVARVEEGVFDESFSINGADNISVVDDFLIVSEFIFGQSNTSLLFKIQKDGSLTLVSSSQFRDGLFLAPRSSFVAFGDYLISSTYDNSYTFMQINFAPQMPLQFSGDEDSFISISLAEADPENDEMIVDILDSSNDGELSFDAQEKILTFTPNADFFGDTQVTIKLSDIHGSASENVLSFIINNINDAPSISTSAIELNEDAVYNQPISAQDIDSESLLFVLSSEAQFGEANISEIGELSYQADADYFGADAFEVTVTDSEGAQTSKTIAVNVLPVNDVPMYTGDFAQTVDEDSDITFTLTSTDVDSSEISYSVLNVPDGFTYSLGGNTLQIVPLANLNGEYTLGIQIDDGIDTLEQQLSISINSINDAPEAAATSISRNVTAGQSLSADLAISDVEDETLSYAITTGPTKGTANVSAGGLLSYTANTDESGVDSLIVAATDSDGASVSVDLTINVAEPPKRKSSGGSVSFSYVLMLIIMSLYRFLRIDSYKRG